MLGGLAVVCSTACQSSQPDRLDAAISSYEARNWKQSLDQASAVQTDSSGVVRDQAALLAGLSSYQLGNYSDAESRFQVSERSADDQTAGESKVMLGDLMVRKKYYADAANYYDAAAGRLSGDAAQRARDLAAAARDPSRSGKILAMSEPAMSLNGNALDAPRNAPAAPAAPSPGGGFEKDSTPPPSPPKKPAKVADKKADKPAKAAGNPAAKPAVKKSDKKADKPDPAAFVIQAGSFILETSAKNRAKELTKAADRIDIVEPWVAPSKSKSGQKIWVVYVGEFESRAAAEKAIKQLGRKDLTVVPNPD